MTVDDVIGIHKRRESRFKQLKSLQDLHGVRSLRLEEKGFAGNTKKDACIYSDHDEELLLNIRAMIIDKLERDLDKLNVQIAEIERSLKS